MNYPNHAIGYVLLALCAEFPIWRTVPGSALLVLSLQLRAHDTEYGDKYL